MQRSTAGPAFLLLALLIAACGGGGTASPVGDTGGAGGGGAATDAPAATDAAPSTAAEQSEAPAGSTDTATGGGSAGGACDLVTTDELAAALGVASVTTQLFAGPPDTCAVSGPDGVALAGWVLSEAGGKIVYDAVVLPGQSTDVAGLGDRAAFVDNTGLLILKGDQLVTISITGAADPSSDAAREMAKAIGGHIAGRM